MPKVEIKITKPSSGKKTGLWRSSRPVITDKCTGCSICVPLCPEGCIKINPKTKKAKIDYDYCKGCLICLIECPFKAIKKEEEKK